MVKEAEQYKEADEKLKEKVDSKNQLESYCYQIKQTVEDEKLKDKISEEDKTSITNKVNEVISWLDNNQTAEKDEFEDQKKQLEGLCNPIIQKLYPEGGMPGGMPGQVGCQDQE